jgi:transcriptional regulator with XRE-family HTH domain
MNSRNVFARNLRQTRLDKGFSQEELAYRANLDRTYISSLERCVYSVSLDVVDKLAKVLAVEPYKLLMPRKAKR